MFLRRRMKHFLVLLFSIIVGELLFSWFLRTFHYRNNKQPIFQSSPCTDLYRRTTPIISIMMLITCSTMWRLTAARRMTCVWRRRRSSNWKIESQSWRTDYQRSTMRSSSWIIRTASEFSWVEIHFCRVSRDDTSIFPLDNWRRWLCWISLSRLFNERGSWSGRGR